MEALNVAEAKSRFSELISRASTGTRFMIRRRQKPVAVVIGASEWERLDRASKAGRVLALALGQDEKLLLDVETGEVHPAMAAWGLWKDEEDLAALSEEIAQEREREATLSGIR